MTALTLLAMLLLSAQQADAERGAREANSEGTVFINQAGGPRQDDDGGKVYLPSDIAPTKRPGSERTPDLAEAEQLSDRANSPEMGQLSDEDASSASMADQLTREKGRRALAQLTAADRRVLVQAVAGTDICEREPDIPAIVELCRQRLENRSDEFATANASRLSPEQRLLGEGLDSDRVASLQSAISRLGRGRGNFDSEEDQAVASVALGASTLAPDPTSPEDPTESQLSAETQALINAIVEQFANPSGGS